MSTSTLTKQQLKELRKLAHKPQSTFGSGRARVQNNLYYKGFVRFVDHDGKPIVRRSVAEIVAGGPGYLADLCEITDAGLAELAKYEERVR